MTENAININDVSTDIASLHRFYSLTCTQNISQDFIINGSSQLLHVIFVSEKGLSVDTAVIDEPNYFKYKCSEL